MAQLWLERDPCPVAVEKDPHPAGVGGERTAWLNFDIPFSFRASVWKGESFW
jgi:hypothetical protein